jgi:hypothetical protein
MSFVTPYGKGLSLGVNGKSWYYDVTDFAPLLKGPKRILMTLGGENQEQMDLDFMFIVGTPPKNVLQFNQLWQGAARAGGAGIGSINNNTRFEPLSVPILNNAQSFKLRSTITGHGAQGEFQQNGGQINHYFNVNGGANEYTWPITIECSTNPIFPQGGTWLYDRQGWCPGLASLLKEYNLTPYIAPGTNVSMDYGCSSPPNPSGDYRYIVANQLISYGPANHALDARVLEVLAPSDRVLYSRNNPICANPVILVQNVGSTALTSLEIEYWVNNASSKETFTWSGNLAFMDTATVVLPIANLWQNGTLLNGNKFNVELKKANSVVDDYSFNNSYRSPFNVAPTITNTFTIEFKTANSAVEDNYKIIDELGNALGTSNFTTGNTIYNDTYDLFDGCYTLIVEDAGGDGLQWWANTAQGAGYVRLRDASGAIIKTFESDFGSRFEFSFSTKGQSTVGIGKNELDSHFNLYPNPSHGKFLVNGKDLENTEIKITDLLGHTIELPQLKNKNTIEFNTSNLASGMYLVVINKNNNTITKKIIVN